MIWKNAVSIKPLIKENMWGSPAKGIILRLLLTFKLQLSTQFTNSHKFSQSYRFLNIDENLPFPPLKIQTPPSRPSWILFPRRSGLLSVLIQTPAMALSNISFRSIIPNPLLYTKMPPFCPPQILFLRIKGLLPVLKIDNIKFLIHGWKFLMSSYISYKSL